MNPPHTSCCDDQIETSAITVAEAVSRILENTPVLSQLEKLSIRDCLNRVLGKAILSPVNVPASNNSAMDGIAMHAKDLPAEGTQQLKVIGTALAGKPFNGTIGNHECIRIMTGAVMPVDVDTVIMQERVVNIDEQTVQIEAGNRKAQNVRFAGEDIKTGQIVLDAGKLISPADLGVIASLGIAECTVVRKPRIAFFSTGDELKSIGEVLQPGDVYDSNRYSLFGLLSRCHVELIDMGVVRDDPQALRQALLDASASADLVITSGGVSVGEADYIKGILDEIGTMDFWKIAMKPGRPLTFGKINQALFFGLPGNPVAVMVTFYQFVLPALKKLAGKTSKAPMQFIATSQSEMRKRSNRREFQRAIAFNDAAGQLQVKLTGKQGSGILTSMSQANCFIILPEDNSGVNIGDQVIIEFFEDYF